jgi:hypothetical protein
MYNQIVDILLNPNVAYLLLMFGLASGGAGRAVAGHRIAGDWGAGCLRWRSRLGVYNLPINTLGFGRAFRGGDTFYPGCSQSQPLALPCPFDRRPGARFSFSIPWAGRAAGCPTGSGLVVSALTASFIWLVVRKAQEAERIRPSHDSPP